jgi:4-amino-4-deoxy-L-arabinose transferase-like glycosyltransferase
MSSSPEVATAPQPVAVGTGERDRSRFRFRDGLTRFARTHWGLAIALAAFGWFVATGLLGIDFGDHWDEPVQLDLVNHTIETASFLPNEFYNYPSVTHWLSLLAMSPRVLARLGDGPALSGDDFFVTTRSVFVVVTGLGGLWLYFAGRRLFNELAGAIAAAAFLLSWELAYHARWIAPDAVAAQFVALFLLAAVIASQRPTSAWRVQLPAAAAAAAAATKYFPGILLLPALILAARPRSFSEGWGERLKRTGISLGVFAAVFVIITPGVLFQNAAFIDDVRWESEHYRTSHSEYFGTVHGGRIHDLTSGFFDYLGRLLDYVVFSLPAPQALASVILMTVAAVGLLALWRRDRLLTIALSVTFGVTVLYFSTLKVFIVRNFLIFLPFIALLIGCGVAFLVQTLKPRLLGYAAVAVVGALLLHNALFLLSAARSIDSAERGSPVRLVAEYIDDQGDDEFVLSSPVQQAFRQDGRAIPENARAREASPGDDYVFWYSQVEAISQTLTTWPTTKRDYYRDFGSLEVNFDYYPTWPGPDRIIVMSRDQLRDVGLTPRELGF